MEGSVRLRNSDASSPSELPGYDLIKDSVSRGVVEVCQSGSYSSVCADSWDRSDAVVACKQLGFSPYGED